MSRADDRIPVPTNGHTPPMASSVPVSTPPPATPPPAAAPTVAFTPGQLAVGFGILASLVLLALGRRRRRGS